MTLYRSDMRRRLGPDGSEGTPVPARGSSDVKTCVLSFASCVCSRCFRASITTKESASYSISPSS
jgi:hypothetical protein